MHAIVFSIVAGSLLLFTHTPVFSSDNTLNWVGCGISKKSYMNRLAVAYQKQRGTEINVQGGGATKGIRDVASKAADLGGACRYHLPDNELEQKTAFEPVAWDALAIIVHKDNPVDNVSMAQVRQIYSGEITNWKQLGGRNTPIRLFARKGNISGVGYSIRSQIFYDVSKVFAATQLFKSSGPLEKAVETDVDAIAITGVSSARLRHVKILSLDDKQPDYASIKSGNYKLYRPLYITYNPESEKIEEIKDFIKFAHSRQGRDIMTDNDVVPYLDALRLVMIQSRQSLSSQRNSKQNLTYQ
jgi:phosphate transport system substrate-binding protein